MPLTEKKIYVAGSTGMVGRAITRSLEKAGYANVLGSASRDVDLRDQTVTLDFIRSEQPEIVILAAGKVGGIAANETLRADFIYDNLMIEANVINAAFRYGVEKLIFLGSSCIYPKLASQPIREEELLTGPLESTNEPYAIAKIAGIKLCESFYRQHGSNFFAVMPTNLYGPDDKYELRTSHVIPALIRKFHEATVQRSPQVEVWGSGKPLRDFLFVDDLAEAIMFLLENCEAADIYEQGISHLNIGSGSEISIADLASTIAALIGYDGHILFDMTKPDGTPRKLLDISRISSMGWRPATDLTKGLATAYAAFLAGPTLPPRRMTNK